LLPHSPNIEHESIAKYMARVTRYVQVQE
jgi:hypothetical protein